MIARLLTSCFIFACFLEHAAAHASLPAFGSDITSQPSPASPRKGRQLLSSLPSSIAAHQLDAVTTFKVQRDWLEDSLDVPDPELYYQDLEDGTRKLIWGFDDTLPRDLIAGRTEVWLQTIIDVGRDGFLLPHFLEHYSRLGRVGWTKIMGICRSF